MVQSLAITDQLIFEGPKLVKVINFNALLSVIIRLQKYRRRIVCLRKFNNYKNSPQRLFASLLCSETNILLSCFAKKKLLVFFEYIGPMKGGKSVTRKLEYEPKYEQIIQNLFRIHQSTVANLCLVDEVYGKIRALINAGIEEYEKQQELIQKLKPEKALNRLKKFFVHVFLRIMAKRNIFYIRKVNREFGTLILMIRRCQLIKNVVDVHLFSLTSKTKYKKISFLQEDLKPILACKDQSKFKQIEDDFYISEAHFFMKPFIGESYTYIERLAPVKLNHEEIVKELNSCRDEESLGASFAPSQALRVTQKPFPINYLTASKTLTFMLNEPDPEAFFSLYKNDSGLFFLCIFIAESNGVSEYLKKVHKEQVSKKDIMELGWTAVYSLIGQWMKSADEFSNYRKARNKQMALSNKSLMGQS